MRKMVIKNTELKIGRPKITIPLTGRTRDEIVAECKAAMNLPCDILEWRLDYFLEAIDNLKEKLENDDVHIRIIRILDDIDHFSRGMPVILTIRSRKEGGRISIDRFRTYDLLSLAAQSQLVSFVDMELFDDDEQILEDAIVDQVSEIHSFGCKVIMSYHDLDGVPTEDEIKNIVSMMRSLGADISKVTGMVSTKKESAGILRCAQMLTQGDNDPVILIGMGKNGLVTRVVGGQYGSVITFAAGARATAPGQIDAETMSRLLDEYYKETGGQPVA